MIHQKHILPKTKSQLKTFWTLTSKQKPLYSDLSVIEFDVE